MTVEFLLALAAEAPSCRVIKLEEEPTPPKAGRLVAGSPDVHRAGRARRRRCCSRSCAAGSHGTMTGFGFPEVLVAVVRRWFAGDRAGAAAIFDRYATLIRFENQALLNLPIRKLVYQRRGAIAHADASGRRAGRRTRARSTTSTTSCAGRGSTRTSRPGPCSRSCSGRLPRRVARAATSPSRRRPARSRRSRTTPPATAGTRRPGRPRPARRSGPAGCRLRPPLDLLDRDPGRLGAPAVEPGDPVRRDAARARCR